MHHQLQTLDSPSVITLFTERPQMLVLRSFIAQNAPPESCLHLQRAQLDGYFRLHGPLTRYVKLWVAHVPGMPGTFSTPPTSMETAAVAGKTFPVFPAHAQPAILRIW